MRADALLFVPIGMVRLDDLDDIMKPEGAIHRVEGKKLLVRNDAFAEWAVDFQMSAHKTVGIRVLEVGQHASRRYSRRGYGLGRRRRLGVSSRVRAQPGWFGSA